MTRSAAGPAGDIASESGRRRVTKSAASAAAPASEKAIVTAVDSAQPWFDASAIAPPPRPVPSAVPSTSERLSEAEAWRAARRLRPVRVELDQGLDGERLRLGLQRLGPVHRRVPR